MKNFLYISVLFVIFLSACSSFDQKQEIQTTKDSSAVNEFEVLIDFVEKTGDFINTKKTPALIIATDVNKNLDKYLVIDIRSESAYISGHVDGAYNVKGENLYSFLQDSVSASAYEKIIITCFSGQTASYFTSLLRLAGYGNVYAMKWGMSSWATAFAESKWLKKISSEYESQTETKGNSKNPKGDYPILSTGKLTGFEIAQARSKTLIEEGTKNMKITADDLFANLDSYYIVNYWPMSKYAIAHIPGAVQYEPKKSLSRESFLSTLPTDKTIVVYCYTGQHSAFIVAYLRFLGYDAKSLLYGANGFMHNIMKTNPDVGHPFKDAFIFDLPVTQGKQRSSKVAPSGDDNSQLTTPTIVPKKNNKADDEGGC